MNRQSIRTNTARFSFPVLACIAMASSACAVQATDGTGAPQDNAATSATPASADVTNGDAGLGSTASATPASATPKGAGSSKVHAKADDFGPFDLINDAKTIYADYTTISGLISPTVPPTTEIINDLAAMKTELDAIQSDVQTIQTELVNLAYADARQGYLATLQQIQGYQAQAQTAAEQLAEWGQTGSNNALLLQSADNNSQIAANSLKESSFYYRPGAVAGSADIFDSRPVLLAYLYALTVRLSVVGLEAPNYRSLTAYNQEFQAHVAWLQQIAQLSLPNVKVLSFHTTDPTAPTWMVCSDVEDTNSGYTSEVDGAMKWTLNDTCTTQQSGDESAAAQYYQFYDNWNVQEELGIHVAQMFAQQVQQDATPPGNLRIIKRAGTYNALAPLVSNTGMCLTMGNIANSLATLETCNQGSALQIWQTAGQTGQAPISLGTTPAFWPNATGLCLEVPEWDPYYGPEPKECSGALSEEYVVTAANQLQWAPNKAYCLGTQEGEPQLQLCNGSPEQTWGRAWPIYIPIGGVIKL